ncbi:MAG: DNA/RNA non-specific endonuclease [Flavobacteriaceae bacterium]
MKKRGFRLKNKTIYTALILLCIVGFWVFENFYTPATYSHDGGTDNSMELPDYFVPSSTTNTVVKHNFYWLSYSEAFEQAEWVAYVLEPSHLTQDDRKRPYFIEDPRVKSKSADWRNYRGSGYDRGHLCPAGDRRFSLNAYNETFYTSNISPQDKDFNAGVWNRLEMQVRYWCKKYGQLYIATGGVLKRGLPVIGDEDVAVPKMYYKIIVRGKPEDLKVLAFLIPHRESTSRLKSFVVPVDRIEQLTGIDFLKNLEDDMESRLEGQVSARDWKF